MAGVDARHAGKAMNHFGYANDLFTCDGYRLRGDKVTVLPPIAV